MPLSSWLTFRQAREAIRANRPEEAQRLLQPLTLGGYRKASRMMREVAQCYVLRGERSLRDDASESAWKELLAAEALNTGEPRVSGLRSSLCRLALAECRAALEAGNPLHVVRTVASIRERNAHLSEFESLETAAQDWVLATEMADRGDFLLAQSTAQQIRPRLVSCQPTGFDRFVAHLDERHERYRRALSNLTDSADVQDWSSVVKWADEVVAVAPTHRDARQLQMKAWEQLPQGAIARPVLPLTLTDELGRSVERQIAAFMGGNGAPIPATLQLPKSPPITASWIKSDSISPGTAMPSLAGGAFPRRFLLWVDGVGGYLVCMAPRITFGQATADGPIDVPLFADVSRLHAELCRDGEGYLVESSRGMQVNGATVQKSVMKCGDRLTLGATCQFLFRQPVHISTSARLELVSGHRLPLAVDGVLLMADHLILGPGTQAHVCIPWAPSNMILYRGTDGLSLRTQGLFTVDRQQYRERANLTLPSAVATDQFAFALEPVGTRL